ncbi:MAG: hypothetical protein IJ357_06510 [Oscillospiraceae bacterium]|nr:hypothetical protein [Oscillospiraceae bacterium]
MEKMKRILSLVLCLAMLAALLPAGVVAVDTAAAGDTIYVLAGGDYQEAGDHANSAANVTNILTQISQKYTTMDGFLFVGDYDCETHDSATETANGIASLMDTVDNTYSNINHANSVLVQGNHDYMDSNIDATGGHDFDGYAAYVLNEDDYPNSGGSQAQIQTLADNLETWLNNKLGEGYEAPIFITSHLPLAFSPRTVTQGDAKYAKLIFDVLNTAADNGLNIIFLHGHDHAYGPDNYMGGEAIYLPEGDKIAIAELGSTSAYTTETLNFTYMNAGYTGYYSEPYTYVTNAGTDKLTMTVFKIESNQVTVERYSASGLYNLKSVGYDGSYSDTSVTNQTLGLGVNSTVYASPQTITLGAVETYGTIGSYVGVTAEVADDVTTSGNEWTTITEPVEGSTTYAYTQANSITAGSEYVIVGNAHAVALMDNDGSMGSQSVTISGDTMTSTTELTEWTFSGSSSGTVYNGTRYLRYNDSRYSLSTSSSTLYFGEGNDSNFTIRNSSNNSRYYYYSGTQWTKSSRNSTQYVRLYKLTGSETTGGTNGTYYKLSGELTYNVDAGTDADAALAAVKAGLSVYEAQAMSAEEAGTGTKIEGAELTLEWVDTFDGSTAGDYAVKVSYNGHELGIAEVVVPPVTTYYVAEGNGIYFVDMNTTTDAAMAAVKAGITVSSATDDQGTNKIAISDEEVTWNWVDAYNGADSGPYTVEILYNGTSLGTVEVKVNVKYETGITDGWTHVGTTEATGGSHTYTLDTDGIDYGEENKYIIVDDNEAIVLNANSSSNGTAHSITISGNTATTTTRDYEYHMIQTSYNGTRYELITKGDGSQYLYQESNGVRYGTRSSVKFQVNHHGNGVYDIRDIDGTNWYIIYNGGWTVTETTSARVRLYKYTGTTGGTPGGNVYAKLEGNTVYTVEQGTSTSEALAKVKAGITGYVSSSADGANPTEIPDSELKWTWKNTYTSMVTGSYWVEISYNGVVLGTVEVKVEPGVINNYPEYPDEGAVKVSKTATGIDFQSSGIAQVEISASGVPMKRGADVIIMLDTSSSMTSHTVTGTNKTRAEVLEESLTNLIAQFKTPGDDGELLDIRVAIADFNGFYGENHNTSGTAYDRDAADMMSDDIYYNANSEAKVYTGDGTLGAGAFINVADLAKSYILNYTSGTNYDYAMDAIYQLGTAIKSNDRDLFVIFMSDGAAMQWNYYHSQGRSSLWNNWITGAWDADDLTANNLNCTTHAYYYDEVDHNGDGMKNEHRMANAIKGDPSETFEVIRKTSDLGSATGETNMYMVPGLGATMFSVSFDAQADTNVTEASMDKSIASLASEQTGSTQYYYKVTSADELANAFTAIGSEIAYAAYNARYVDQMGDDFNLQMKPSTYKVVDGTSTTTKTLVPVIEIITYDIYTRQDYLNGTITEDKIGDRKGTSTLQEVIKFSDDGNKAYSNLIDVDKDGIYGVTVSADGTYTISDEDDNILGTDGVIYAKTFLYNTNVQGVAVEGVNIPTGVNADGTTRGSTKVLPSETFYWKMDTITTSELAMRYYVYLEGSMEGTREAGSYPTNEYANLYYDNYLGNPCHKDTVSPVMAWKSANVSYAFYLVNENGEIIVNQTTGQTGSFANKIAVTNPVVYEEILLNNTDQVQALNVKAISDDVLPKYYELYDEGAIYTVTINSNATGSWVITNGGVTVNSTYVTNFGTRAQYDNTLENDTVGDDYTHTVVWFAVVWKVQALPDAVVIDYGLPVDISVLTNDMFGENGKLAGVGAYGDSLNLEGYDTNLASGFGNSYTGTYGTATANVETGKVRYTPTDMEMNGYDKFAYAVNYKGTENAGYYYDTVTVIPATTIYYEDSFVAYDNLIWQQKDGGQVWEGEWTVVSKESEGYESLWTQDGTTVDGTQDEDRPGKYSLTDANNIYGYDSVNKGMSTYSMGSAMKATVDYDNGAQASFTFWGTGFDVISMTDSTTGTIFVKVYDEDNKLVKDLTVDTYYGYNYGLYNVTYTYTAGQWVKTVGTEVTTEGATASAAVFPENPTEGQTVAAIEKLWVLDPNADEHIWQVPVMEVEGLEYGKYTVKIQAIYEPTLDHETSTTPSTYDFYLDAIRIYDPANDGAADGTDDTTIENAYKADGEGWPSYIELRNKLISASSFDDVANDKLTKDMEGLVFIDGDASVGDAQIEDYVSYGPNNEVYLAPGQRVAFLLSDVTTVVKDANGNIVYEADGVTPKTTSIVAQINIGISSANGAPATYTITNIARSASSDEKVTAGDYYNAKTFTVDTTTDMYYDITGWKGDIIVISNTGDRYNTTGILSLTNIKATYTADPNATSVTGEDAGVAVASVAAETEEQEAASNEVGIYMTPAAATLTLRSLNASVEEEPEVTEPSEPEETET